MEKNEFTGWRARLWPIKGSELKKFIPLVSIFFLISFNYSLLRAMKDIFILNNALPESLYSIKLFVVTPVAIIYTAIYNMLVSKYGRHRMFYIVVLYFVAFFAIFALVLYPNLKSFYMEGLFEFLVGRWPRFEGLWGAVAYWHLSLFYLHAELWGTFGISVALWTFINEITSVKQSKRFYSFLALGANFALLFSATALLFTKNNEQILSRLVYLVIGFALLVLFIYRRLTKNISADPVAYDIEKKAPKKKAKMSFIESTKFLASSRYLRLIAALVLSYGFIVSLIESVWKSSVKELNAVVTAAGGAKITTFVYAVETFAIGLVAIISIFAVASWAQKKGWKTTAMITPLVAAVFGAIFFSFIVFQGQLGALTSRIGFSALAIGVAIGMAQVVFIKAFKYTLFDPSKEAAYIPLDQESKVRGKAAVDGAGGRLGKSLGALLLQFVLIPFIGGGRILGAVPQIGILVALALILWITSVSKLSVEFKKLTKEKK